MLQPSEVVRPDSPSAACQGWRVIAKIGSGSCCDVYKVCNVEKPQNLGALKVFKCGENYERARDAEAMLLDLVERANGPCVHLVQNYDVLDHNDHTCLVQELLNLDLRQVLMLNQGHSLSMHLCRKLLLDILSGLHHLHKSGFVHGDLKPTNMMWSPSNSAMKIIDFSLSYHVQDMNIGKLQSSGYRAPEVDKWNSSCDTERSNSASVKPSRASDMWSVGCLLADMLSGSKVFTQDKLQELQDQRVIGVDMVKCMSNLADSLLQNSSSCSGKDELTGHLRDLFKRLLSWEKDKRPTAEQALSHQFFKNKFMPSFTDLCLLPSPILRLLNIVTDQDLSQSEDYQDLILEVKEECSKYGEVSSCVIPREGPGKGKVYVEFTHWEMSQHAYSKLSHGMYNGHTVVLTFFPKDDFDKKDFY